MNPKLIFLLIGLSLLASLAPTSAQDSLLTFQFSTAGGVRLQGADSLTAIIGQPSPVGVAGTSNNDTLFSGFIYTLEQKIVMDMTAPEAIHTPVSLAPAGQPQMIAATLRDNLGIQSATLSYRQGGASSFKDTVMTKISGDTYQGTIPSSFMTERGTEYYISTQDAARNRTTFPATNPQTKPQVIQVTNSNLAFGSPASPTPAGVYRMISVPFDLSDSSASAVLGQELGAYNTIEWRLFRYKHVDTYLEFNSAGFPRFAPGNAFWLITKTAKTLAAGAGKSVTTAENYKIPLPVGWSQIGNPFHFTVNWSDVIRPANVENRLVGFSGNTNTASGYGNRTQLVPFEGYFVNNLGSGTVTLEIPPIAAAGSAVAKENDGLLPWRHFQDNEWALQITATTERYFDNDNYIGGLNDADDAWDANDFSEAPFFADLVSLYFPHPEWQIYPGKYTGDFRQINAEGGVWDFEVRTTPTRVTLALAERLNVPEDWKIMLLDKSGQIAWDFREQTQYTFVMATNAPAHLFSLVVGKSDFVENNDLDLPSVPQAFALSQNYPNPFSAHGTFGNPETRLNYELPMASQLKITIYNLQGQEIQTLVEGPKSAGRFTVSWDGTNRLGIRAASGVYLVRMEVEKFVAVRKIVLAR